MTRAEARDVIQAAGLRGVRVTTTELGGRSRQVLVGDGLDTGFGPLGLLGTFDGGRLAAIFPQREATVRGVGAGDAVSDFERAFPGRVTAPQGADGPRVVTLRGGARLQLGSPSAYNDPSSVASLVILPPGTGLFAEFG